MSQGPKVLERRWIILAQDGRHVTMGRAAPPTEAEVEAAAAALDARGEYAAAEERRRANGM